MRISRLYTEQRLDDGQVVTLEGEQARYLGRALRLKPGDQVALFNADAGEWLARIEQFSRNKVDLLITDRQDVVTESPLKIHLVQGVSRGERMDFVVQKATELGVKRITPVLTDHGVVRFDDKRATKRLQHWQSVAISACEQSGRVRPPLIDEPMALNEWFGRGLDVDSTQWILSPYASSSLPDSETPAPKLCLLIGPEGGFSDREYDDAEVAGFTAVTLGPRVLRTETAAIAAISVAQARWGDLASQA